MRKTVGSVVVIDTNPPHRPWDGNQATYLFFPLFSSFLLILIATLSSPIIPGLPVAQIHAGSNGTVNIGLWGWCAKNVPGVGGVCSNHRAFGSSMVGQLEQLPEPVKSLAGISDSLQTSYLVGAGVMHIFACLSTWLALTWTLAASGEWENKRLKAYDWTRWAFAGSGYSAMFILIAWALELGMFTRIKDEAINVDGSQPTVKPGTAIWLYLPALLLTTASFLTRLTWGKFKPRPLWTIPGAGGDFHSNPMPPDLSSTNSTRGHPESGLGAGAGPGSAALQPSEEYPPTWESLDIRDAKEVVVDEKDTSLGQPGFAV
ncbi:hypothetical protein IAT38_006460 [Cryptococcus sp. DSM 104549]